MQIEEQRGHDRGRRLIEVAGRLVAEQQPRLPDERARNRHALLLAARQLRRAMIDAIGEADLLDQRLRARGRRHSAFVAARPVHQRRHEHVLEHRALRQQAVILEDEPDLRVAEVGEIPAPRARTDSVRRA